MEKQLKTILYIVLAILLIDLSYNFFFGTKQLKKKIESIETRLDSTIIDLNKSISIADSIQSTIKKLGLFIDDVQGRAEVLDLERRMNDQDFRTKRDSINKRLNELYKKLNITGKVLQEIDDSIFPL